MTAMRQVLIYQDEDGGWRCRRRRNRMAESRANKLTEIRSEILNEAFKGLVLVNAGGAIATATLLQRMWDQDGWRGEPRFFLIVATVPPLIGIGCALLATIFRYVNSLRGKPSEQLPNCWWATILGLQLSSVAAFVIGMLLAVCAALKASESPACRACLTQLFYEIAAAVVVVLLITGCCWIGLNRARARRRHQISQWPL